MYYNYGALNIRYWLNDPSRPKDLYKANIVYLREAKELSYMIGRNKILLWFLIVKLNMGGEFQTLFSSCKKQKELLIAVKGQLKERGVTSKYIKVFKRDFASIRRRSDYVYKIIVENLRMTEYYPYFESVGFEILKDFSYQHTRENGQELENKFYEDIIKWNAEHQKEIADYMESIKEAKENLERHRAKIQEDKKREKAEAKAAKAEILAFEKESAKIRKKQKSEYKKIEKSFERYYSGKY